MGVSRRCDDHLVGGAKVVTGTRVCYFIKERQHTFTIEQPTFLFSHRIFQTDNMRSLRLARGLLLRARAPLSTRAPLRAASSSSVDDALRAALAKVVNRVQEADAGARPLPDDEVCSTTGLPGAVRTSGPKMLLRFTCAHEACEEAPTITRVISKSSYEKGVVIVRCPSCQRQHLIADHLGWVDDKGTTIESIMAEKGEAVQRSLLDEELLHIDEVPPKPDP